MAEIGDELLAAYHDLYETWLLHTAPEEIGVPGYHGLRHEDEEALEECAYRVQYLLGEDPSPPSRADQGDRQ